MCKEFISGQKVVFSTKRLRLPADLYKGDHFNYPQEGEIVTVFKRSVSPGFWIIREYLLSKFGDYQGISDLVLFPTEEIHAMHTDNLLLGIEKSIYKFPQPSTI